MGPEEAEVDMVYISSGKGSSQRYVRASVNCGVCFKTAGGQDRECTCVPLEYSDQQTLQPYSLAEPYVITSIGQSYSQINPFPTFTAWGLCCGGHRHCGGYTAPPCIQTMSNSPHPEGSWRWEFPQAAETVGYSSAGDRRKGSLVAEYSGAHL